MKITSTMIWRSTYKAQQSISIYESVIINWWRKMENWPWWFSKHKRSDAKLLIVYARFWQFIKTM